MKIVFFCSGNGGNLKFIHLLSKCIDSIEILALIADRECGAENYAKSVGIHSYRHSFERTINENLKLMKLINKLNPDVIVTNVHKIISESVLNGTNCEFINLHYSLLPSFAGTIGMKPVDDAIQQGCKFLGSTCHKVTKEIDLGPILAQSIMHYDKETFHYDLIFKSGCLALLSGLMNSSKSEENNFLKFNDIIVNPGYNFPPNLIINIFKEMGII
jgi:phosphoribosylglycinamide formyltransferase-1